MRDERRHRLGHAHLDRVRLHAERDAKHRGDPPGIAAGGIDDAAGAQDSGGGLHGKSRRLPSDREHFRARAGWWRRAARRPRRRPARRRADWPCLRPGRTRRRASFRKRRARGSAAPCGRGARWSGPPRARTPPCARPRASPLRSTQPGCRPARDTSRSTPSSPDSIVHMSIERRMSASVEPKSRAQPSPFSTKGSCGICACRLPALEPEASVLRSPRSSERHRHAVVGEVIGGRAAGQAAADHDHVGGWRGGQFHRRHLPQIVRYVNIRSHTEQNSVRHTLSIPTREQAPRSRPSDPLRASGLSVDTLSQECPVPGGPTLNQLAPGRTHDEDFSRLLYRQHHAFHRGRVGRRRAGAEAVHRLAGGGRRARHHRARHDRRVPHRHRRGAAAPGRDDGEAHRRAACMCWSGR